MIDFILIFVYESSSKYVYFTSGAEGTRQAILLVC